MKAKKYLWSIICVYFCYLTHGIQAIILSQNNVNFAKQWGFNMSDPQSAAYAAGLAAVSTAVAWTGFGKFVSVWIGGEISDRVGRKKLMIGGAALYIICFLGFLLLRVHWLLLYAVLHLELQLLDSGMLQDILQYRKLIRQHLDQHL